MADKFINSTGLSAIKSWILTKLGLKQDALVSGTNIKTVSGTSLLGSGNIDAPILSSSTKTVMIENNDINIEFIETTNGMTIDGEDSQGNSISTAHLASTNYVDTAIATELAAFEHLDYEIVQTLPQTGEAGVRYLLYVTDSSQQGYHYEEYLYVENQWIDIGRFDEIDEATETTAGTIKLNPSESISVNANGQLTVGGRLGQFTDGGLYYPTSADPVAVGNYTLLMSEAKGLSAAHREFVIAGGSNVTLKTTAQAGATQYQISNTQTNRFLCSCFKGGRLAVSEAEAKEKTVAITSVKFANGNDVTPYFGATESNNNIIITVAESLNPSGTLTQVRGYGTWTNADIMSAGQGNRVEGGKHVQVGQGNHAVGNQMAQIGIRQFSSGNSSIQVGADNINKKMYSAMFGQGIDNTGGIEGGAYFGKWPIVSSDTAFVVGNGTAYDAKSNLFEIKTNGDIYINGVKVL